MQTWVAHKAAVYLSKQLNTTVSLKSIYVEPFSSVVIEDFYVLDQQKDTIINAPKLTVDLLDFSIFSNIKKRTIDFNLVQLDNASIYLKRLKDSSANYRFILDHFKSTDTTKSTGKPWTIKFDRVVLNNVHFRYKSLLHNEVTPGEVNFNDVDVKNLSSTFTDLDFHGHIIKTAISHLTLKEKSGLYIKNLSSIATVDTDQILLQHLLLITNRSNVSDYFRMKFASFDDFDDFEDKVYMDGDFKSSRISSLDVGYFTTGLQHVFFDVGIDGRIKGPVNSLKAKNLTVTSGQATYVKGDFSLKGLPHWDKTFLELRFEQIATNKKDLDLLYSRFTGTPNRHLPDIIGKFGNINFSGQFTGFQNDFIAYGDFKTKLGRFNSDINLKFDKNNVPSYSGKLNTSDFDIGNLLDAKVLGRTTLAANIKGRGFELKNLTEQLDTKIKAFEFNGYNYKNVTLNGVFLKRKFDGAVTINDQNINLDFKGDVDLNNQMPVFNFISTIKGANLNELKLLKDTISIDAQVASNFSGTNIENIEGKILMHNIKLNVHKTPYLIDSVYFAATGKVGESRRLLLKSDFAEGSLVGNYDLATLPAYYQAIAKKYIPSLKINVPPSKPQNFDFNLQLKNLDPITALFAPRLKLPDQGTFVGKFNSANKTATLNGIVKTLKYNNIVFHDLLIDESTSNEVLDLNLSLSKVNFSDSVFVKDINITNFLQRDSLNFNIKLSDKNAVNQLDLYGLVAFGRDSTAKLNLLPSDIIIEHQVWKLANNVNIRFINGGSKTEISGFDMFNGQQHVKIDGLIASGDDDRLNLNFEKFNMNTLDQLSKSFGIKLDGKVNGNVAVASITGKPNLESKLTIDSLAFNKSVIGDVKFVTQLDDEQQTANVKLNILNRGLETLSASGAYKLEANGDNLDFNLQMNQTDAAILEPFTKSLVSNLKGSISSDLKLTGTLSNPLLNGTLTLANTGVTVNYLKTPYIVNDKVDVVNSVVNINNLVLKDSKGGTGTANGTVDLSKDMSNPTLNVTLNAQNLLALNTTFRDNRLYYGTAYGTGTFSFVGPIDNMRIDIKAKTEAGTIFNIPLNTSSTASDYEFIRYVSSKDTTKVNQSNLFKGITLNFDLSADEKTTVKIYTDYGLLTGTGTANNLSLKINSLGDFDMLGNFLISSGKFEFTAKSVISKVFQVNQGGTIRWTGSPSNADINLQTTYEVRANIGDLYAAAGLTSPKGQAFELVQAQLLLTGPLIKPNIDFDFSFPTDPSIKDELSNYLNDPTNRSQQALSLIVRRSFNKGNGGNGGLTSQVSQTAQDAFSELIFNKFNSVLSQNVKAFDLNISSAQEASASLRLFNDRLVINGSLYSNIANNQLFGNSQYLFNSNFTDLTKDFQAQYSIRQDGRLTATYSYRALNTATALFSINNQLAVQYVNGVGLIYHRDFDTFHEFWKNIFGGGKKSTSKRDTTVTPTPIPAKKQESDDGDN